MPIEIKKIEESREMKELKNEIAAFRRESLKFIGNATTEENALKRAKKLTERLKAALTFTGRQ